MTDARLVGFRRRSVTLPAAGILIALAGGGACKDDDTQPPDMMKPPVTPPATKGSAEITGLKAVGSSLASPFDATPSPKADKVYFTAMKRLDNGQDVGALYAVNATGGEPTELADGFVAPISLVVSTDGNTVFVADLGAGTTDAMEPGSNGIIYSVPSAGGTKTALESTKGYQPRGLDLVKQSGSDTLYFAGTDPEDQDSGVFKMASSGGAVSVVSKDLDDPSGIAVHSNGTVYVTETNSEAGLSGVFQISGSSTTNFLGKALRVGYPAGLALSQDEKFLLVSGLAAEGAQATVYRINLGTKVVEAITGGIEGKTESGGVHRAHDADAFAWADCADPKPDGTGGGTVFLLGTKAKPLPQ